MNTSLVRTGLFSLLSLFFAQGWAASAKVATVDAVQMPAWLERGGWAEPLVPGQRVTDGDRVRTGAGARAYLKLPEGSTVKLGESALLTYQSAAEEDSIFKAALNVATGAFRFTTAAIRKLQKRDVSIRVGNATIGIRGTDVWGRSGKDQDLVMLIEGHVEVKPVQGEAVALTEPMAVFTAPKDGAANPVGKANGDEFKSRARETEIEHGDGAVRSGGRLKLVLGSFDDEQQALAVSDHARAAGFGVKIKPLPGEGENAGYKYEVALYGFADKAEIATTKVRLKALTGIDPIPVK